MKKKRSIKVKSQVIFDKYPLLEATTGKINTHIFTTMSNLKLFDVPATAVKLV